MDQPRFMALKGANFMHIGFSWKIIEKISKKFCENEKKLNKYGNIFLYCIKISKSIYRSSDLCVLNFNIKQIRNSVIVSSVNLSIYFKVSWRIVYFLRKINIKGNLVCFTVYF